MVEATLTSTLDSLDDAVNYRAWILDLARPYLNGPILEIGAGHGTFTGSLADVGPVYALEPGEHAHALLEERYAGDDRVSTTRGVLRDVTADPIFASAVMINVLEHIDDDQAALGEVFERLQPGGHLVVWVPAFELLYSEFDRELGHYRRYRRPQLVELVRRSGFRVERSSYVNLPGWFSWLVITRLLGQRPTAGPLVTVFDRVVVPVVRAVESRIAPPFGQSVILIARKPSAG